MLRKISLSVTGALLLLLMLSLAVMGQADTPADAADGPRIEPTSATVTQTVPLSLTIIVPGPDGAQTITVPIFLNLDLRIDISSELTASVAATATTSLTAAEAVTLPAAVTPTETVATPEATEEAAEEATAAPTPAPAEEPAEEAAAPATPEPEAETPADEAPVDDSGVSTETVVGGLALLAACPNENVRITGPVIGSTISGVVNIEGTANNPDFQYYKVEYIAGEAAAAYIGGGEAPVVDGILTEFDTQALANGAYSLLLTVVDNSGNFPDPCAVAVTIEN